MEHEGSEEDNDNDEMEVEDNDGAEDEDDIRDHLTRTKMPQGTRMPLRTRTRARTKVYKSVQAEVGPGCTGQLKSIDG